MKADLSGENLKIDRVNHFDEAYMKFTVYSTRWIFDKKNRDYSSMVWKSFICMIILNRVFTTATIRKKSPKLQSFGAVF